MSRHYHLIGIGGIGMSGIAALLLRRGIKVSGSDLKANKITDGLKKQGVQIFVGHDASNIKGADLVIYSSAIKEENPEIVAAKAGGIALVKRAQALAELMKDKVVITVAGSHGKTTTTSLVSYLLLEAGLFPTAAIGGILRNIDTNAYFGDGKYFVAEADESDGSFLYYHPKYSIVTNIDHEHLDYYNNFQNELDAFSEFINLTDSEGCLFCCADDVNLRKLIKDYKKKYVLFGLTEKADIYPVNISFNGLNSQFDCFYHRKFVARFELALGGMHNISNSLAVVALGVELGISLEVIKNILKSYKGAGRRIEVKYDQKNCIVIDDYAHHPTEIMATIAAIKNLRSKRIIAVFQPHRYSRTKLLLDEFSKSFDLADYLIITDIYPASEPPMEGITGALLSEKVKRKYPQKEIHFLSKEEIVPHILRIMQPNDLVITLGAGDIVKTCEELVAGLENR